MSHAEKYIKKLFGFHSLEDSFQRLDKFTIEILTISARIDEDLIHVDDELHNVNTNIHSVVHEVSFINTGDLFLSSLGSEARPHHARLGGRREGIRAVYKRISDINRSLSPNLIAVTHEALTSRIGNESRKDLRRWISPPDRCSRFYTASEAHHEGTAAWCIEGNTFADWMASGSLFWIHGKRKYTVPQV